MARRVTLSPPAKRSRRLAWYAAALGACLAASLAFFDPVVRTQWGKLGAVDSWTFEVRVLGVTVHRAVIVVRPPDDSRSRSRTLDRAWRVGLAVAFALVGGSLGFAAVQSGQGQTRRCI
jgi:hypothetical protein